MILQLLLRPSHWRHAITSLALCMAAASHASDTLKTPGAGMPSDIVGTWEVVGIHVDTGATRTLHYRPDDFRLNGRIFHFSHEAIASNTPERQDCPSPGIAASIPVAGLIESSMAGRATPPANPTAEDYQLQLPADPGASAITVKCKGKLWGFGLGREDGIHGAWLLPLPGERLAVRWHDETILELKRVPENARPIPSFDCTRTSVESERAICHSIPLAKLDVSVAKSYAAATRELQEAKLQNSLTVLKAEQRAWLLKRNRCKSDAACLENAMSLRLEAIDRMQRED
ncbi:hypothetical protein RY831_13980 [Noviherbaspirillum sp. CPCC 100848]|uniref:DUF1311 domain-containing protein n=2 Tax=Noviherbaspirillum album TaxID=3080276 RepID=A0ABU6JAD1_9BURK|nr:hypothetical protein [Noviherbaspirillum sp. CPCC 100848]